MRAITISGLNTGVLNSVSASQDVSDIQTLVVNVAQASGNIAGAVVTVEQSIDGTTWVSTGVTIAAAALSANIQINTQFMRLKVTTASGAASTADCTIQGKFGYFPILLSSAMGNRVDLRAIQATLSEQGKTLTSLTSFMYSLDKAQRRTSNGP